MLHSNCTLESPNKGRPDYPGCLSVSLAKRVDLFVHRLEGLHNLNLAKPDWQLPSATVNPLAATERYCERIGRYRACARPDWPPQRVSGIDSGKGCGGAERKSGARRYRRHDVRLGKQHYGVYYDNGFLGYIVCEWNCSSINTS